MQGVSELRSSNTGAIAGKSSEQVCRDDFDINPAALSVFQNFVEGIVAASLTSTMDAAETPSTSEGRVRRSSRLKKIPEVVKDLPAPLREEPVARKVRLPLPLRSLAYSLRKFTIAQQRLLRRFCGSRVRF